MYLLQHAEASLQSHGTLVTVDLPLVLVTNHKENVEHLVLGGGGGGGGGFN